MCIRDRLYIGAEIYRGSSQSDGIEILKSLYVVIVAFIVWCWVAACALREMCIRDRLAGGFGLCGIPENLIAEVQRRQVQGLSLIHISLRDQLELDSNPLTRATRESPTT